MRKLNAFSGLTDGSIAILFLSLFIIFFMQFYTVVKNHITMQKIAVIYVNQLSSRIDDESFCNEGQVLQSIDPETIENIEGKLSSISSINSIQLNCVDNILHVSVGIVTETLFGMTYTQTYDYTYQFSD